MKDNEILELFLLMMIPRTISDLETVNRSLKGVNRSLRWWGWFVVFSYFRLR